MITQKDLLMADGLTGEEINKLAVLAPQVSSLCNKLSDYTIKPSFVQPDFNDNNTLVDDQLQTFTMIDLGEIAISHPFFSLLNMLLQIKKHHGLTEEDDAYQRIRNVCLQNFKSKGNSSDALMDVNKLFPIYGALAGYRLINACGKSKFTGEFQRHGKPGLQLREFMAVFNC